MTHPYLDKKKRNKRNSYLMKQIKKWAKISFIAACIILLILWLLSQLEAYQQNMIMIQQSFDTINNQMSAIQADVASLKQANQEMIIRINGVEVVDNAQNTILQDLLENQNKVEGISARTMTLEDVRAEVEPQIKQVETKTSGWMSDGQDAQKIMTGTTLTGMLIAAFEVGRRLILRTPF
jgi:PDZ domain-containing secreted protein